MTTRLSHQGMRRVSAAATAPRAAWRRVDGRFSDSTVECAACFIGNARGGLGAGGLNGLIDALFQTRQPFESIGGGPLLFAGAFEQCQYLIEPPLEFVVLLLAVLVHDFSGSSRGRDRVRCRAPV